MQPDKEVPTPAEQKPLKRFASSPAASFPRKQSLSFRRAPKCNDAEIQVNPSNAEIGIQCDLIPSSAQAEMETLKVKLESIQVEAEQAKAKLSKLVGVEIMKATAESKAQFEKLEGLVKNWMAAPPPPRPQPRLDQSPQPQASPAADTQVPPGLRTAQSMVVSSGAEDERFPSAMKRRQMEEEKARAAAAKAQKEKEDEEEEKKYVAEHGRRKEVVEAIMTATAPYIAKLNRQRSLHVKLASQVSALRLEQTQLRQDVKAIITAARDEISAVVERRVSSLRPKYNPEPVKLMLRNLRQHLAETKQTIYDAVAQMKQETSAEAKKFTNNPTDMERRAILELHDRVREVLQASQAAPYLRDDPITTSETLSGLTWRHDDSLLKCVPKASRALLAAVKGFTAQQQLVQLKEVQLQRSATLHLSGPMNSGSTGSLDNTMTSQRESTIKKSLQRLVNELFDGVALQLGITLRKPEIDFHRPLSDPKPDSMNEQSATATSSHVSWEALIDSHVDAARATLGPLLKLLGNRNHGTFLGSNVVGAEPGLGDSVFSLRQQSTFLNLGGSVGLAMSVGGGQSSPLQQSRDGGSKALYTEVSSAALMSKVKEEAGRHLSQAALWRRKCVRAWFRMGFLHCRCQRLFKIFVKDMKVRLDQAVADAAAGKASLEGTLGSTTLAVPGKSSPSHLPAEMLKAASAGEVQISVALKQKLAIPPLLPFSPLPEQGEDRTAALADFYRGKGRRTKQNPPSGAPEGQPQQQSLETTFSMYVAELVARHEVPNETSGEGESSGKPLPSTQLTAEHSSARPRNQSPRSFPRPARPTTTSTTSSRLSHGSRHGGGGSGVTRRAADARSIFSDVPTKDVLKTFLATCPQSV